MISIVHMAFYILLKSKNLQKHVQFKFIITQKANTTKN